MTNQVRGLRGVLTAVLVLEALAVALAFLVVAKLGDGTDMGGRLSSATVGAVLVGGLFVALVVAAALQGRSWGPWLALAVQVLMIATAPVLPAVAILGVLFGLVVIYVLRVRRELMRRMAATG